MVHLHEITCVICGGSRLVKRGRVLTQKTCSPECLGKYRSAALKGKAPVRNGRGALALATCSICGEAFSVKPKRAETQKTCSSECLGKLRQSILKGVKRPEWEGEKHPGWTERINFTCKMCGCSFGKVKWETTRKDVTNEYCSVKCRAEFKKTFMSGPNAPDYVGGTKFYRGKSWPAARLVIVEAQSGNCADCGKHVGKSLPVHHICPFRNFATSEEANVQSNLIGLCPSCHMRREHGVP